MFHPRHLRPAPGRGPAAAAPARAVPVRAAAPSRSRLVAACMPSRTRCWCTSAWPSSIRPAARSRCVSADGALVLAVNGEIYNHRELQDGLAQPYAFHDRLRLRGRSTRCIARAAPAAFATDSTASSRSRCGMRRRGACVIARDRIGVCPLYWGHDADGRLWVASEMKALVRVCADVAAFPPGHWYDSATGELVRLLRARRGATTTRRRAWKCRRRELREALRSRRASPADERRALRRAAVRRAGLFAGRGVRRALRAPPRRGRRHAAKPGGRACIRFAIGLDGFAGPRRRARSPPTRSARCTTASPTPSRKGWTRCPR